MNDDVQPSDTPSDELVAVSAILDGTATADERALVEASPELGGLVDELRTHRQAIVEVEVPDAVRESAIAAALAAFDELHVAAAPLAAAAVAPANVVSLDRRRRMYRRVTGAAAAVIVVVVGVAALEQPRWWIRRRLRGDDVRERRDQRQGERQRGGWRC